MGRFENLIQQSDFKFYFFSEMKLGLLLSGAVRALDIQSQFRAYIDTAYPSCQAVIAKCERPFIGYDVKEECNGVEFSQACRRAGCAGTLCNLFEDGISKCHNLCKLGPMKDDCRKCVYLPLNDNAFGTGPSALEEEINGLELIHSLARGRKEKEELSNEIKQKKDKLGRKRNKKNKKNKIKATHAPSAYTPPPDLSPT